MAYRRPGVEVVQQFQALVPALVLPALPAVIVGPAFQIEDDASTATAYAGVAANYAYPNLVVGAVVDTALLDATELSATQKPISVKLINAFETIASASDGTKTSGDQTFTTVATSFANVTLSAGVQYFVDLNNTDADDGKHLITAKTSDTEVELADEMTVTVAGSAVYKVLLKSASITYESADFATVGITTSATQVSLPINLSSDPSSASGNALTEASDVELSYRALRPDLADSLDVYTDLDSLEAVFGVGNVTPANPYGFGTNIAINNTTTEVNATGLRATFLTDETAAYTTALSFLESQDVYGICILTQDTTTHQNLSSHVTGQSVSTVGRERVGFINRKRQETAVTVPTSGVGTNTTSASEGTSPLAVNTTFDDTTNGNFILDGVSVGMFLEITSFAANEGVDPVRSPSAVTSTGSDSITVATKTIIQTVTGTFTGFVAADVGRTFRLAGTTGTLNDGDFTIATVTNATTIVVTEAFGGSDESGGTYTFQIVDLTPSAAQTTFITGTRHAISVVDSNTKLTLGTDPTNGFFGTLDTIAYQITDDLSLTEQADFLEGYASSFANRRLVSVQPDTCFVTVSGTSTELPGFYLGCALTGLTAGLPSQQGFTNLSLTGFVALKNSSDVFNDTQLDEIAGGGNLIVLQETASAPVFVRHQLTTDTSSIQFQELSVTKNVDLTARFFRNLYQPYIGKYNITDTLLDLLKSITVAGIDFLKNSTAPRVGGVLRDGSLTSLGEDATQPDTVNVVIDINIPLPLNNVKVTLLV
ncbi:MAG: hypothetical protein ACYTBJ_05445 [Planctomycetota bacterium]|jgi:hypothetical protein